MKELFQNINKKIDITSSLFPFIIALVFVGVLVISLSFRFYINNTNSFYENILVEAHGMLLDIFIFGLLFTYINLSRTKKLEIRRYKEEIDDFRHWTELVASYRIAGILRRLDKYKIDGLDLTDCNLKDAQLEKMYLKSAILEKANLEGAALGYANLKGANMRIANLKNADLRISNLQGADLKLANLEGATLRIVNLQAASLFSANLEGADLKSANLQNADLSSANLENADLSSANLEGADLRTAKLMGADLRSAKLKGADLRGANLVGIKLGSGSSLLDSTTKTRFENDDIDFSQFQNVFSLEDAIMPDGELYSQEWSLKINKVK